MRKAPSIFKVWVPEYDTVNRCAAVTLLTSVIMSGVHHIAAEGWFQLWREDE